MPESKGKTISEKILSAKSSTNVYAGDFVEAEIDYVMVNDITGPIAFREFDTLSCEPLRDKIVLVPDHFVPNKDVPSAEQATGPQSPLGVAGGTPACDHVAPPSAEA